MKNVRLKNALLGIIAAGLGMLSAVVIYADVTLGRLYAGQRENLTQSSQATPVPVLAPTPAPTRKPLAGDIGGVPFPEEDTGEGALYSYQTDELRVAVDKVHKDGVTYYVADIWMRNINCFRTAFSGGKYRGKREPAEKIAQDSNAVLAVNGDFLGGLVLRNGKLYRKANLRPTPIPSASPDGYGYPSPAPGSDRPERATCVLYYDGRMATEEYEDFSSSRAMKRGAWQGWQFGPTLIRNGKPMKDVKSGGRSPRCIVGCYEPGHYCLITIDGRQKGYSVGMNFREMTELAQSLGLKEAYNLDGGGSAIMVFDGKIINSPSGRSDARRLPDMIVIGEYTGEDGLFAWPTPSPAPGEKDIE